MKKIILAALILSMSLVVMGCGSDQANTAEPKQQEEQENTAVETTLGAGEWYVGEDIPPGRYVITPPDNQSGLITIYDKDDVVFDISEILNPFGTNGVKALTYNLVDGQKVEIEDMEDVLFTPKED